MNRDEILKMPAGTEMDSLIQEHTFGSAEHLPCVWEEWSTPDGLDGGSGFVCPRCHIPEDDYANKKCSKHYSRYISYAFEVVERVRERLGACKFFLIEDAKGNFRAIFSPILEDTDYEASAETAPLAICRAASLVALVDNEK